MPGFTTHYLFGIKNLRRLQQDTPCCKLSQSIRQHQRAFQLGLQGPDIFFYHPASQLRKASPGSITHRKRTGTFLACLVQTPWLFSKTTDRQIAEAYAAGFLGHYILDTQLHPYVYCMTGMGETLRKKGYADHITLESDMDACMLMRFAKCMPSAFAHGNTIAIDRHTRSVIADALRYAYQSVFPELSFSKNYFVRAIRSIQWGTRLTFNPHNYKRQLVQAFEKILLGRVTAAPVIPSDTITYHDPLNLGHRQWHNPWDTNRKSTKSVLQLAKIAAVRYQTALGLLNTLYSSAPGTPEYESARGRLAACLGQQSYHSGLDWKLGE